MAYDGIMMSLIKKELNNELSLSFVNQIYQPSRDEFVFLFRTANGTKRLLLCARADAPRVHLIEKTIENPSTPPMLCMLFRKHLSGAKLVGITQPENERILFFDFETVNELGDVVKLRLIAEIMGGYSNIILTYDNGDIIDSVKRVDISMSKDRIIIPKVKYELPKKQEKLLLKSENIEDLVLKIQNSPYPFDKAILNCVQGVSPVVSREIEYMVTSGISLEESLKKVIKIIEDNGRPTMIIREDNTPMDISFIDVNQYGDMVSKEVYSDYSSLIESFYINRDIAFRMRAKTQALNKLINNAIERISKKINIQLSEYESCKNRETLRIKGDLLQSNLSNVKKGSTSIVVDNYYSNEGDKITIELNPALSPAMNAQKYYKAYAKAKNAEKILSTLITKSKEELIYFESVQELLSRVTTEKEIAEIRRELIEEGYIKEQKGRKNKVAALPPKEYFTKTGYRILVGRNNKQNDILTLKYAKKNDLWFHTKDVHGSHVILETRGDMISHEDIYEAAILAATNSKARYSQNVAVDYTKVKNVSKPNGAKPGMVIYVNNKTLYVTPKLNVKE